MFSFLISQPLKKVPPPPAGTTIRPTSIAAVPLDKLNCCSINFGRKAPRPVITRPSIPLASEMSMCMGFLSRLQIAESRSGMELVSASDLVVVFFLGFKCCG